MNRSDGNNRLSGGRRWILPLCVAAASLTVLTVMASLVLRSCDDFWYQYFLDGGLGHYLSLMKYHYLNFNGRILVHAVDQIVLHFDNWCFVVVCDLVLAALPVVPALASGLRARELPAVLAVFLTGVLLLPYPLLNEGVLWISAFFNYVFPTALISCAAALFHVTMKKERAGFLLWAACGLSAFLCGASTEQSGLAFLALMMLFFIKALKLRRGRAGTALCAAASGAGLLTIFLSPGTLRRLGSETQASPAMMLHNLLGNIDSVSAELSSSILFALLLAVLFWMTGELAGRKLSRRWPVWTGAALCAAAMSTLILQGGARAAVAALLWAAAGLAGLTLMLLGEELPGAMMVTGLFSLAAILPTGSAFPRTLVPCCLALLSAAAILSARRLSWGRRGFAAAFQLLLLCAGVASAVPFLGGMVSNYKVDLENRENLRTAHETGDFRYNIDYDLDYTWMKLHQAFSAEFLEGEGFPPDTEIRYYSRIRPRILVGGEEFYPAYVTRNGEDLLWIRILEELGGETIVRDGGYEHLTLVTPWMSCDMDYLDGDTALFTWSDADGTTRTLEAPRLFDEERTWFPMELYSRVFGLRVAYDEAENTYSVLPPEGR